MADPKGETPQVAPGVVPVKELPLKQTWRRSRQALRSCELSVSPSRTVAGVCGGPMQVVPVGPV